MSDALALGLEAFKLRAPEQSLPYDEDGNVRDAVIVSALEDASGVIKAHLPWLCDEAGVLVLPLPERYKQGLEAIAYDIAYMRMADVVKGSEEAERAYVESMRTLRLISEREQGSLEGPGLHDIALVDELGELDLSSPACGFWPRRRLV